MLGEVAVPDNRLTGVRPQSEIAVNTDTEKNRRIRGQRQYAFEQAYIDSGKMHGLSLYERFLRVREGIFAEFGNIKGSNPTELISTYTPGYPSKELSAAVYLPAFYRFIDTKDEGIRGLPRVEDKAERGLRLAVLNFFLGITIHQSSDGNGQTNKLISLSYIREYVPEFAHNYFPIKYDIDFTDHAFVPDLIGEAVSNGLPFNLSEYDAALYAVIPAIRELELQTKDEILNDNLADWEAEDVERDAIKPLILKLQTLGVIVPVKVADSNPTSLRRWLGEYLHGRYPGYFFDDIAGSTNTAKDKSKARTYMLTCLLTQPEGKKVLELYIDQGSKVARQYCSTLENTRLSRVLDYSISIFNVLEEKIVTTLLQETREKHEQAFKKTLEQS